MSLHVRDVGTRPQVERALIWPDDVVDEAVAVAAYPAANAGLALPAAAARPRPVAPVATAAASRRDASAGTLARTYRLPACQLHAPSWFSTSRYTPLHRQHTRFSSPGSTATFFVCWCFCISSSRVRRCMPPPTPLALSLSPGCKWSKENEGGGMGGRTVL